MPEVITLGTGSIGIAALVKSWELFCREQGINQDGSLNQPIPSHVMYAPTNHNQVRPRTAFFDHDLASQQVIQNSQFRDFFGGNRLHCDNRNQLLDKVRLQAEQCDMLEGFIMLRALVGQVESHEGDKLTIELQDMYPQAKRLGTHILPQFNGHSWTKKARNIINSIYCMQSHENLSVLLDDDSLNNLCKSNLQTQSTDETKNQIIAHNMSHLTSALRWDLALYNSISQIQSFLVPNKFPRLHLISCSMSPLKSTQLVYHQRQSLTDLFESLLEPHCSLLDVDIKSAKIMRMGVLFRGGQIVPKHVGACYAQVKTKRMIPMVDWNERGPMVGLNYYPSPSFPDSPIRPVEQSLHLLVNSTAMGQVIGKWVWRSKQNETSPQEIELKQVQEKLSQLCSEYETIQGCTA